MSKNRKVYAPFSLTSELGGVTQTPVEGYIDVEQRIKPTLTVGSVDEKGIWSGVKSDDREFFLFQKDDAIPNTGEILYPADGLDMIGFRHMMLAIKPTNGGNYAIQLVMGPDTNRFNNLQPVNSGSLLKGFVDNRTETMGKLADDSAEALTADVWNIYAVLNYDYSGYENIQWKITNNSGGESFIETAVKRLA